MLSRLRKSKMVKCKPSKNIKGIILDVAGTFIDPFVVAPTSNFVKAFKTHGLDISTKSTRLHMGLSKDIHIQKMVQLPEIKQQLSNIAYSKGCFEVPTVDDLYDEFHRLEKQTVGKHTTLIYGAYSTIQQLQNQKIKFGITTGYNREILNMILKDVDLQNIRFDSHVTSDEVSRARPAPFMIWKNMENLKIINAKHILKVDDTNPGIEEGHNAGCWTCAVVNTSAYMNVDSWDHFYSLSEKELAVKQKESKRKIMKSKPHFIIDDISQLPLVVNAINQQNFFPSAAFL